LSRKSTRGALQSFPFRRQCNKGSESVIFITNRCRFIRSLKKSHPWTGWLGGWLGGGSGVASTLDLGWPSQGNCHDLPRSVDKPIRHSKRPSVRTELLCKTIVRGVHCERNEVAK
jgi:hypothetical protein